MTQAVATVRDGHAYQARQFWLKALRLLDPAGSIVKVGFECGPKGFDDVWVEYAPGKGRNDHHGVPLLREHMQCKWHVASGDFGYEDLTSPDFINASSVSLLQRALDAQRTHAPAGAGSRFRLVTNWHLRRGDPLNTMVHQRHGFLRLDRLFDGTGDGSTAGKVRKIWRDHLGVDDAQLRILARTLGLSTDTQSLLDLRDNLDLQLELRGIRRVPDNEDTCWYDDLTYQWLAAGRIEFDRDSFRDACQQQKLFEAAPRTHVVFGVKSFEHPVDSLEDRCVAVLNLVPWFDDGTNEHLRLILDTHATLAFAAGAVLNIKSGRHVELEQRVLNRVIWRAGDTSRDPAWPGWDITLDQVGTQGSDVAVGVCLTHDVGPAVKRHLAAALPGVGRLLLASPQGGANSRAVASGQHAFDLAESLAQRVNAERQPGGRVHLFVAAPNAFTFFLGQRQPSLGSVTMYEFDFEGQNGGGYRPSIALPVA